MDVNWNLRRYDETIPLLLEEWLSNDFAASLESRPSLFGDGDVIPVYRAESPDVAGELWAVGEFGDDRLVLFFYLRVSSDRTLVVSTLDPAWNGAPVDDPGDFLDWAARRIVRTLHEENGPATFTPEEAGGDPKCD